MKISKESQETVNTLKREGLGCKSVGGEEA